MAEQQLTASVCSQGAGAHDLVTANQFPSVSHVKNSTCPSASRGERLPHSHVWKTSRTCLSVSGEFLSGFVFPAGACFSRLKGDDVRETLLLLQQIEGLFPMRARRSV